MAKGLAVIAGAGLVAALAIGVPYICGLQFEKQFRAGLEEAGKQIPYPLTLLHYDRGLFGAEAETQIEIPLPAAYRPLAATTGHVAGTTEPLRIRLHHHIVHGPRLSGLRFVRVVTTPLWPDSMKADVTALFKDQAAVTLISDVGFLGGIGGRLDSPAIDTTLPAEGPRDTPIAVKWGGIDSRFEGNAAHDHVKYRLRMPRLDVAGADQRLGIGEITSTGDLSRSALSGAWLGTSNAAIESVRVEAKDAAPAAAQATVLQIDKLALVADSTETDGLLKSQIGMSAARGDFQDTQVQKPLLRMTFSNLDAQALGQWREQVRAMMLASLGKTADAQQQQAQVQQMMASVGALLPKLLARKPAFAIDELSFDDGRGPVRIKGEVRYVGTPVAGEPLRFVPTDVEAQGSAEMPVAFLDQLITLQQAKLLKATHAGQMPEPDRTQLETRAAAAKMRDDLVSQSLVKIDGERASTVVDFKAGAITVNGKPFQGMPPPAQ